MSLVKLLSAEPLPVNQRRDLTVGEQDEFRTRVINFLRRLQVLFTGQNILDSITGDLKGSGPSVFVIQEGQSPTFLKVPDDTKDYILAYDAGTKKIKWIETTSTCP